MDLPARKPLKVGAQARFMHAEIRKMHKANGRVVLWEQAAECPCVRRTALSVSMGSLADTTGGMGNNAHPRLDCAVCSGRGYLHHSPQQIQAVLTGADGNPKRFEAWGENMLGMLSVTPLPENLPGFLDRFTIIHSVMVMRETRTRTAQTVERLRFPIVTRALDLTVGVTNVSVLYAHKANAEGIAEPGGVMTMGEAFEVTDEGEIDWSVGDDNGKAPEVGGRYSMSYFGHPSYLVVNHPHAFRDVVDPWKRPVGQEVETAMVVNAMCRLEFLGRPQTPE